VNSIDETVRKYCVDDTASSPERRPASTTAFTPLTSTSVAEQPTASRRCSDVFVSPCRSVATEHRSPRLGSAAENDNNVGEVSFASVARGLFSPVAPSRCAAVVSKPASIDVGVQVDPADFQHDAADSGRAEIGVQAGDDQLCASSLTGQCPYCHSQLPADHVTSAQHSGIEPATSEDNGAGLLPRICSESVVSSSVLTVSSPASLSAFVPCSLSLGDSFHCFPLRTASSVADAPITIFQSATTSSSSPHNEAGLSVSPATAISVCHLSTNTCHLSMNTSPSNNGLGLVLGSQHTPEMHNSGFASLPNAHSQSVAESSLINTPMVTFSITPETARLATSADSGGQLSNTSLSNITLSDLLPSMQGSIPLELLVNQTDGFTMYTEIVPISEPCQLAPASPLDAPSSVAGCSMAGVSDACWSPVGLETQESPVNVMVCLPISSVSSPSLSSFLSQHRSLSSFAGDAAAAAATRPPSPGTSAAEIVDVVMGRSPKPTENYSIHRIVETSALKQASGMLAPVSGTADCSWSSSNTGVLISRRNVPTSSVVLSDYSINEDYDHGQPPPDGDYHGDHCCHDDDSCQGDESCHGDDVCVIDSDRDVIVIDGDEETVQPNAVSDSVSAVPERTRRVGRHGRRRRQQLTNSSSANVPRSSRRLATSSAATVDVDADDRSMSVNCLDNGFVETSPTACAVGANAEHQSHLDAEHLVIFAPPDQHRTENSATGAAANCRAILNPGELSFLWTGLMVSTHLSPSLSPT